MAGEHKGGTIYTGTYYHSKQWYADEIQKVEKNYIKPYEQYEDFNKALKELVKQLNYAANEATDAKKNLSDWLTIDGNPVAGNTAGKIAKDIKSIAADISSLMGEVQNEMQEKSKINGQDIYTYKRQCLRAKSRAKTYKKGYEG